MVFETGINYLFLDSEEKYETHIISGGWSKYDKEKYLLIVSVYASSFIKGSLWNDS